LLANIDESVELEDGKVTVNRRGMTHIVFHQKYGEARVYGANLSINYDVNGSVYLLKSSLIHGIDIPKSPNVSPSQAAEIAEAHAGKGAMFFADIKPLLIVAAAKTFHLEKEKQEYYLCWQLTVIWPEGGKDPDWIYFIDATDGKVLFRHHADRIGDGIGNYSPDATLNSEASGAIYRLRDTSTSSAWAEPNKPVISTYDDAGSTSRTLTNYSEDANDDWDNVGPPRPPTRQDDQGPEVDIHRYVGYVLSYFYLAYGYNSLDGGGVEVKAHAHNERYANNAYWSPTYKQIYFADGDGDPDDPAATRDFMCPLDVVAHEFGHGVKYYLGILQNYDGESGALDEGINDLFGALIALLYPAEDPWPWHHGRQYRLDGTVGRHIKDPSRDDAGVVQYDDTNNTTKANSYPYCPDHYSLRYTGADDSHGVHYNCPIISHAVYLMIEGGTHRLSDVTVNGIGIDPVEQMLWDVLTTNLLTDTSDFADFRLAFIQVCLTLYPENLDYLAAVKSAFHAVGIGPDLYIRDRPEDNGEEPGTLSCMSPDIIVRQQQADAATLAQIADPTNASLSQEIELGPDDHFVYFRIFNRGSSPDAAASGTFRLFISPASTFPTPDTWHEVGHYDFPEVPAKAALADPPGIWVPNAGNQCIILSSALINQLGVGHYCFIGIIESPDDPAPDWNLIDSYSEFHDFISKSNNYAWRNCNINDDVQAEPTGEFQATQHEFQMNGMGKRREPRDLEIDTRDMPLGTQIAFWIPAAKFWGLRAFEAREFQKSGLKADHVLKDTSIDKLKFHPLPLNNLVRSMDLDVMKPKVVKRESKEWYPLGVNPGKMVRFSGLSLKRGERMQVRFTVKFPKGVDPRDVTLSIRERRNNIVLGQMNYIFKIGKTPKSK
ncbi:MAG: M4 family metallopeptidase, partial [Promethearchaeota archaeon]